jgi:hypothetical protein
MSTGKIDARLRALMEHSNLLLDGFSDMVKRYAPDNPPAFMRDATAWMEKFCKSLDRIAEAERVELKQHAIEAAQQPSEGQGDDG